MPIENNISNSYTINTTELGVDPGSSSTIPTPILKLVRGDLKSSIRRSKPRHRKDSRKTSKSEQLRSHLLSARAFVEEERQRKQWKSALREASDLLGEERRRVEEAMFRASVAERREKEALTKVEALEALKVKLEAKANSVEQSSRDMQVQLEMSERESRTSRRDLEFLRQEFEELDVSHRRSQGQSRKYQHALREREIEMDGRENAVQAGINKAFGEGEHAGYKAGYDEGYAKGKRDGKQQGIKLGRKEGLIEGKIQGRIEERRDAVDAIDKFLAVERQCDAAEIRRWAQSVYYPESQANISDTELGSFSPLDDGL